ncbi:TPA: hypothetical protein QDB15_000697 [Burkholderia vietnamiensis]|uniref:hypothetical protein n=1 Tax=Burkholderia cepacia complex TaxID=87882 RepID=UPI001592CA31|nr:MULTISPECIES: hypothetical protein [Burkholderia cepacia complex]MCA8156203.1 hypothetical protein [Burkholderia contaminans]MCA8207955.1 hypothetical protein [Burkholderia vietnamiensis]HDR9103050.1 hypothetical protein [Burkholderia vietnamiensis]HDR9116965.1 hypothetical protein [Burkholderia vietnamiensis]HDR9166274.1 hypothetical protein [Burkholderia vietnamiensis]
MSTITYEVLSPTGLVMKRGEPVVIKNAVGMTFGVHCNDLAADDERFVVTNIETGMSAGKGVTREIAIECARKDMRRASRRGELAQVFENSMKLRGSILAGLGDARAEATA